MKIKDLLKITEHRTWELPKGKWSYYQEWNNTIFLHWQVDFNELNEFIPQGLEIDLFEERPWVSLVAFTMENIRPRRLPPFPPVSTFHEVNIRTYVKYQGKPGVYFLNMQGSKWVSCLVAKKLSDLPYSYAKMKRESGYFSSTDKTNSEHVEIKYGVGTELKNKTPLDKWLTERYALFQDTKRYINHFEIHHPEWPTYNLELKDLKINFPRFNSLINTSPDLSHYSPGVQVLAWDKNKHKISDNGD